MADVQEKLRGIAANQSIEIRVLGDPSASPASPLREDVMAAITKAVHSQYPGIPIIPSMSSGATDGKFVRDAGIPTYGVLGAFMREEDEFSHGLNERVLVKSFFGALDYWHVVLHELAGR